MIKKHKIYLILFWIYFVLISYFSAIGLLYIYFYRFILLLLYLLLFLAITNLK
jgi:hypothetical protein